MRDPKPTQNVPGAHSADSPGVQETVHTPIEPVASTVSMQNEPGPIRSQTLPMTQSSRQFPAAAPTEPEQSSPCAHSFMPGVHTALRGNMPAG